MIRTRFFRSLALLVTAVGVISCTDAIPTSPLPAPATAENGLLSGLIGGVVNLLGQVIRVIGFQTDPDGIPVNAVQWAPSHTNQVRTVSATIGYNGGTLAIPGSDFTITFPYGALTSSTNITITSDGSGYVTYDMQPHGLTFRKPVIVTQRLNNTAVYGTSKALNSFGAYFAHDLLDLSGILRALEIETTTIFANPRTGQAEVETWVLNHFSRYMLASN
ncbi:MAG TPA: hypothetical protein VJ852_02020 [Gemmatimonadaceae bacterium]|nr:hypothetical protein [Gemmatimonadaceae bacterium]